MNTKARSGKIRRMTGLALFTAIIVVLTILCTFIRFGPFSITLALAPIVIGAAMYGCGAGAYLGTVLGVLVLLTGVLGWDGGTVLYLLGIHPLACILICVGKGVLSGWAGGLVYRAIAPKHEKAAVVTAGIVTPVANTGVFILGMATFFFNTLAEWAGGQAVIYYIIVSLTGINFLVELAVNIALSSGIVRIIRAGRKV